MSRVTDEERRAMWGPPELADDFLLAKLRGITPQAVRYFREQLAKNGGYEAMIAAAAAKAAEIKIIVAPATEA